MGKYMKKSKISGDVAAMDGSLGVRTRAKTLALQRRLEAEPGDSSVSYLQLRSRRLEKSPPPMASKHQQSRSVPSCDQKPSPKAAGSRTSSVSIGFEEEEEQDLGKVERNEGEGEEDLGFEASLGENDLELETRERGTRESTPCSYVRDSNAIGTPGSTTRRSGSKAANRRLGNDVQRDIPTSQEMEEFFANAEQHQQRLFMEKYNFDVVNDLPLPGRYDWVRVSP